MSSCGGQTVPNLRVRATGVWKRPLAVVEPKDCRAGGGAGAYAVALMETVILAVVAAICVIAAGVWARSARHRLVFLRRVELQAVEADAIDIEAYDSVHSLARSSFRKEVHAASLYLLLAIAFMVLAVTQDLVWASLFAAVAVPAVISLSFGRNSMKEARISHIRFELERRAEEVLAQEDTAPKAWAGRLAPDELPDFGGFDVGRVYQAGSGLLAGDFFDVFRVAPTRLAAVVGDVAGHGIEASITAFQAKYLLRVFLRQFRDPAQALEELNRQMSAADRGEEFISLVLVVFDTEAGTLRYASAGHPTAWLWHEREVQPLRATGSLLMLDPSSTYYSKEIPLEMGDLVLMYTDGLAEVRSGDVLFGEERVSQILKRDPSAAPDVLCKTLLEAAQDFAGAGPIVDDVAILAVRRS